jgi:hypothetical protein
MKALLICPADRPGVPELALRWPLATAPVLGRTVLEYWIEALATRGAKQILVLASDRPTRIREHVGDGRRWGVQLEIVPTGHELTVEEARRRYQKSADGDWLASDDVVVIDHLPGQPDRPMFDSYAGWFEAVTAWMPHAVTPGRVGAREIRPGVFVGLRSEIDPTATLHAPCWIGDYVRIGARASIGPGAVVDDRAVVEPDARIGESAVGPDTYVGRHVSVDRSLAFGPRLINWQVNSTVEVPDSFLLADLAARRPRRHGPTLIGRVAALLAMVVSAPFAIGVVLLSLLRGYPPWYLRLGLRARPAGDRPGCDTFGYYELTGAQNWLRRWPQFWNIVMGDMAWFGNRPLRPTQALTLANDFERLWLAAPVGIISLADAHGCPDGISDEAVAHASYYAVHAGWRLDAFIFFRSLLRAALVWPIRGHRRNPAAVTLQNLATRQEL